MAAMATVSMFLSPRDSTLSVNSEGGGREALQPREVTLQTEVTVATECPLS